MIKVLEDLLGSNMTMEQWKIAEGISADITNAYTERHRYYHTLEKHINPCFEEYEEVAGFIKGGHAFKLALLYHDFIYTPGSDVNEKASADRMAFDLIRLNINEGIISNVRCLILSEINKSRSIESKIFHDIDYSVLGKDKETYLQYSKYIKFENEFFPDYNEKRMSLLQSLLKKRRIYLHDYFYDKYEKQARINIANEIESLNKK